MLGCYVASSEAMIMNHQPRRMLPPGTSRKRKHAAEADKPAMPKAEELIPSNWLLAGYMAHEFLTKGTLLGQKFDPDSARAEAGFASPDPKRSQPNLQADVSAVELSRSSVRKEHESYDEVASIMKTDGTHIKGIVNPTQLSRWIRM